MKKLILSIGIIMLTTNMSSASEQDKAQEQSLAVTNVESTVQDNEGNVYRTVKIGGQLWLAENLRATKFQDGSEVKTGFIPDDKEKNLAKFGRLYDWHDVADERNICPAGWRVASDEDWKALEKAIGISEEELDNTGWRGDNDIAITLKAAQPNTLFKVLISHRQININFLPYLQG